MSKSNKWIEISDVLSDTGMDKIKTGQVLGFSQNGTVRRYRVMRKSKGKCWVQPIEMHNPNDVVVTENQNQESNKS